MELAALECARQADDRHVTEVDDPGMREINDARPLLAQLGLDGVELGADLPIPGNDEHR